MLKSQTTTKNPTSQHAENYSLHSYATNQPTFYHDHQTQSSLPSSQNQPTFYRDHQTQPPFPSSQNQPTFYRDHQTQPPLPSSQFQSHMETLDEPHMQNLIQSYKQTRGLSHLDTPKKPRMQKVRQSDMPLGKSGMQTLQESDIQVNGQSLDYSHQSSSVLHTPLEPNHFSTIRQNNSSSSSASTYSKSVQSETNSYKSTLHQPSFSSAPPMDEQDESNEAYEMMLLSEAEIIDREGNFLRTQTMTSKDVYKLNEGEMIVDHFNDLNQPIKSAGGLFTRFMTLLVKEPNLCPLDAKDWRECKKLCGVKLIMELRRRFDFPQSKAVDDVVLSHLSEKFRTLKHRMKKSLLALAAKRLHEANDFNGEMQYTDDQILQALDLVEAPEYFVDHQWESYKRHLRAHKTKQLSAHGKKARGSRVHIQTTGAVSLARKKDKFKVENKREPDDIEIFEMGHVTKLGSYIDDRSRVLASKAKAGFANKLFEVENLERNDPKKRLEIAREIMQELRPKKHGRPFGYGVGVTKSQVTKFSFDLRRIRLQGVSSENRFLLNKVADQSKQIEKQSRQMKTMEENMENMTRFFGELKSALPEFLASRKSNTRNFTSSREDCT